MHNFLSSSHVAKKQCFIYKLFILFFIYLFAFLNLKIQIVCLVVSLKRLHNLSPWLQLRRLFYKFHTSDFSSSENSKVWQRQHNNNITLLRRFHGFMQKLAYFSNGGVFPDYLIVVP